MNAPLSAFQDDFVDALYGMTPHDARVSALIDQPGFTVYRNTVFKGCIDALYANFPTVARLVGDEWFRAAAAIYVQASPPDDARLLHYGAGFAAFLERFEPARELPYLPDVARLDRLWTEAHVAADDTLVDTAAIAGWAPAQLERAVLRPHAATRWLRCDGQPAYTIWRANREAADVPEDLAWQGEGALLLRPAGQVIWRPLSAGGCAFLDACAAGLPLEPAAQQALVAEPDVDFGVLLSVLLAVGAIAEAAPCRQDANFNS